MAVKKLILLSFLMGLLQVSYSQDTLVFCKKNDSTEQFKIPLSSYDVVIHSKKHYPVDAIITAYNDTSMTVRIRTNARKDSIQDAVWRDRALTMSQKRQKLMWIEFSQEQNISLSDITGIDIHNSKRREKRRMMKVVNTIGMASLAAVILVPLTLSLPAFIITEVCAVVEGTFISIISSKHLNLKKKWEIKRLKG